MTYKLNGLFSTLEYKWFCFVEIHCPVDYGIHFQNSFWLENSQDEMAMCFNDFKQ